MEETDQDIASAFEVGLIIGVSAPNEVVAWADTVVGGGEYPPAWVIPIALAQETDRLALLKLLRVAPEPSSEVMRWCLICEAIMGALDQNTCSLRQISSALTHCSLPESEEAALAGLETRYEASDAGEANWVTVDESFLAYIQGVITDVRMGDE
ncbi:MAG: hypothetical protein JKY61_04425 [Planctomycetes bacterium]|nr:hypothetical protein [Planctomycetota bacterium]